VGIVFRLSWRHILVVPATFLSTVPSSRPVVTSMVFPPFAAIVAPISIAIMVAMLSVIAIVVELVVAITVAIVVAPLVVVLCQRQRRECEAHSNNH